MLRRPTRARHLWLLTVVLAALALAPPAGAQAALGDEACRASEGLIAKGLPQQARSLAVATLQTSTDPCLDRVRLQATAAITSAEEKAAEALGLIRTDPSEARKLAEAAEKLDSENATLTTIEASLPEPAESELQKSETRWDGFVERYLEPLQALAIPFLVGLAGLLVLARICTLLPFPWPRTDKAERRWILGIGLALAVAAAGVLVIGAPDATELLDPGVGMIAAALAVLALVVLTIALATRLRLIVEVRDDELDEAATGHVVALLSELGAEPPSGLEVDRGADVTELDGTAIFGTPEGKLVKVILRVWQGLLGSTPWRVRVDQEGTDALAFVITRNGRTVSSGVIDRNQLGLDAPILDEDGTPARAVAEKPADDDEATGDAASGETTTVPDLHRFAAAAVLTTLARHYKGFEGLYGVTDWRSLGLHYVATVDYSRPANVVQYRAALAQAVERDPRNVPARVALRHSIARGSEDLEVLGEYLRWLLETADALRPPAGSGADGTMALRLRVHMTLVAVACNYRTLRRDPGARAVTAAGELIRLLDAEKSEALQPLVLKMRPCAATAYLFLDPTGSEAKTAAGWLSASAQTSFSPTAHYDYACYLAQAPPEAEAEAVAALVAAAVRHLRLACVDPQLEEWMATDPSLRELRATREFDAAFPEVREEFVDLEPLSEHADALRAAGLDNPWALGATDDWRLARLLEIDVLIAARIVGIAQLAAAIPRQLDDYRVDITAAFLSEGIASVPVLRLRLQIKGVGELLSSISTTISGRRRTELSPGLAWVLQQWLFVVRML